MLGVAKLCVCWGGGLLVIDKELEKFEVLIKIQVGELLEDEWEEQLLSPPYEVRSFIS